MSRARIPFLAIGHTARDEFPDGRWRLGGSALYGAATAAKLDPWYPDHAVFSATKDQLKAMPEFKYST